MNTDALGGTLPHALLASTTEAAQYRTRGMDGQDSGTSEPT